MGGLEGADGASEGGAACRAGVLAAGGRVWASSARRRQERVPATWQYVRALDISRSPALIEGECDEAGQVMTDGIIRHIARDPRGGVGTPGVSTRREGAPGVRRSPLLRDYFLR